MFYLRPDYNGIKFYSYSSYDDILSDISSYEDKIDDLLKIEKTINEILELYNISKYLSQITTSFDRVHALYKLCFEHVSRFMDDINDVNFIEIEKNVCGEYYDDFWEAFEKFKTYKNVSEDTFKVFLFDNDTVLSFLFVHKEIVYHYDEAFKDVLLSSSKSMNIISSVYLEQTDKKYCLPKSLSPQDTQNIIERYIGSENANPNILQLIYNAPHKAKKIITSKLRLGAKNRYKSIFEDNKDKFTFHEYAISISFEPKPQDIVKQKRKNGDEFIFSYDVKWLERHLDYPTILNNFIFVFDFVDNCCRSILPVRKKDISAFEKLLLVRGKEFYPTSFVFTFNDNFTFACLTCYRDFLLKNDVSIEDIFKWFFEKYLPEEFHISGFIYNASSNDSSYLEKCKNLCSELENVLSQFELYVNEKEINRDLLEVSSSSLDFSKISSLLPNKYVYVKSQRVKEAINILFSDQSTLAYIGSSPGKYSSFFQVLLHERIYIDGVLGYQTKLTAKLEELDLIKTIGNNVIQLNLPISMLLYDLYNNEVICYQYLNIEEKQIIKKMVKDDDLEFLDTLFTIPEQNYLSYMLNNQKFSNGPALRNKYSHGRYHPDERIHYQDYINLLKIMILVVVKINEEFQWNHLNMPKFKTISNVTY